jgi:SsrA-binding protein
MAARREQSLTEVNNPKAGRDYFIGPTYEAGIVLRGTEVKSLRAGRANIADAFIKISPKGVMLYHAHIAEYDFGNLNNHASYRTRQLLLKQAEVEKIAAEIQSGGHAIVPLKIYFKHGLAKCLLAVGKGKKMHDKRQDIKEREAKREISRAMSRRK